MELGRDADTGGQTKYVVDLAKALAEHENVDQVDLVTRRIVDDSVSEDYAQSIEQMSEKARIIRIDAGPEEYTAKEQLWDHLDSFMDNLVNWLNEQSRNPDIIHSHYADAGYVGVRLSNMLGAPLIHTGHSLGRDKRKQLLANGLSSKEIEDTYNIARRIDAEEELLANADMVITSTHNEIDEQYSLYNYFDPDRMRVIPPGTNMTQFYPPDGTEDPDFLKQLPKFLNDPDKPLILALSRPDERKNILTLVEVFGESEALQKMANLLIVAGSREDIRDMDSGPQSVLTNIMWLIDYYDLYGKVALPQTHAAHEVPEIYRLVATSGGVFINPALTEPFGLTLLEAAASGLPIIATENGGPVDIIKNCKNGELIDPLDKPGITEALIKLLGNKDKWSEAVINGIEGVNKFYSWKAHVDAYMNKLGTITGKFEPIPESKPAGLRRHYRGRAIISDLDQSLLGDSEGVKIFSAYIRENRKRTTFGISTGRRIDSALAVMKKYGIPTPDVLISSLGTRIHYGKGLEEDSFWADHIDHNWNRQRIKRILSRMPGLKIQPKKEQSNHKISYYYDAENALPLDVIIEQLLTKEITANVTLSFGQFLDIIPSRASKGQALRYVAQRLDIPLEHILVAGGSGTDEDMIRGNTLGVVVKNRHDEELSSLLEQDNIYFSEQPHAQGIIEATKYYNFEELTL